MKPHQRIEKEVKKLLAEDPDGILLWKVSSLPTIYDESLQNGFEFTLELLNAATDLEFPIIAESNTTESSSLSIRIKIPPSYPGMPPIATVIKPETTQRIAEHTCINSETLELQNILLLQDHDKGWSRNYSLSVMAWGIRRVFLKPTVIVPKSPHLLVTESVLNKTSPTNNNITTTYGTALNTGTREYMEDRVLTVQTSEYDLYVVADGHGGEGCVSYVISEIQSIIDTELLQECDDINIALYNAFNKVDKNWRDSITDDDPSGSTLLVALRKGSKLYVANTGDSRAVLLRNSQYYNLSNDHKANCAEEVARVVQSGGYICMNRIFGSLAITRTIGDCGIRNTEESFASLIPSPEVISVTLESSDVIVLACDGLFDVVKSSDLVSYIMNNSDTLSEIAEALVNEAVSDRVVADNTSVIVIKT